MTGASGTVAIALMNLVKNHGVSYIWPAIILAGFANAMALLIVALQLRFWRVSADDAFAGD
eukprot:15241775-Ditylum_brightwellii.AAC.1